MHEVSNGTLNVDNCNWLLCNLLSPLSRIFSICNLDHILWSYIRMTAFLDRSWFCLKQVMLSNRQMFIVRQGGVANQLTAEFQLAQLVR